MLKKENRLKNQGEFSQVLKDGQRFRGQFLVVVDRPSRQKQMRVGIIVTKKVDKKAVGRNRLRRIIAHLFEHLIKESSIKGDVVVIVTRTPDREVFNALERDIHQWHAKSPSS